jgi:molecular chaperone GrpE
VSFPEEAAEPAASSADPVGVDARGADGATEEDHLSAFSVGSDASAPTLESTLDDVVVALEAVTAERDEYLDLARRVQAEFENYRRRVDQQKVDQVERAAEGLVGELLPVLDACELALEHDVEGVAPIHSALLSVLERQGLTKLADAEVGFDPNLHEAVMTAPLQDSDEGPMIDEVMRAGYVWKGRVVRPAMVRVRS